MHKPNIQRYVLRIIALVPIYSVQSWLTLWPEGSAIRTIGVVYGEPFRDVYESYALASFLYYLVALAGGEDAMIDLLRRKDRSYGQHTMFPFRYLVCCLTEWEMGEEFLLRSKQGVLIFATLNLVGAVAVIGLKPLGLYGGDSVNAVDPRRADVWINLILSGSMSWALYCLVMLYRAIKEDLKDWNLIGKFLCIKGVVFFTFWQGIVIIVIQHYGGLSWGNTESEDLKYVREKMQALLIIVEMLGFSIAHRFAFTYRDYCPSSEGTRAGADGGSSGSGGDDTNRDLMASLHEGEELYDAATEDGGGAVRAKPMSAGRAFWSFVPDEGLADLKRLSRGIDHATNEKKEHFSCSSVEMGLAQKL